MPKMDPKWSQNGTQNRSFFILPESWICATLPRFGLIFRGLPSPGCSWNLIKIRIVTVVKKTHPTYRVFFIFVCFGTPDWGGSSHVFGLVSLLFWCFSPHGPSLGQNGPRDRPEDPQDPQNTPKMVPGPPPRTPQDPQHVCFCSVTCQTNGGLLNRIQRNN